MKKVSKILNQYGLEKREEISSDNLHIHFKQIKKRLESGKYKEIDVKNHLVALVLGSQRSDKVFVSDKTKLGVSAGNSVKGLPFEIDLASFLTVNIVGEEPSLEFDYYFQELEPFIRKKMTELKKEDFCDKGLALKVLFNEEEVIREWLLQVREALDEEVVQMNKAPFLEIVMNRLYSVMKENYERYLETREEEMREESETMSEV